MLAQDKDIGEVEMKDTVLLSLSSFYQSCAVAVLVCALQDAAEEEDVKDNNKLKPTTLLFLKKNQLKLNNQLQFLNHTLFQLNSNLNSNLNTTNQIHITSTFHNMEILLFLHLNHL